MILNGCKETIDLSTDQCVAFLSFLLTLEWAKERCTGQERAMSDDFLSCPCSQDLVFPSKEVVLSV